MNTRAGEAAPERPDALTVASVAIVVYLSASIVHEGIGHGLTTLVVGGKIRTIASTFCDSAADQLPHAAQRAIDAGGTFANFAFGAFFWWLLRIRREWGATARLFLWLSMILNLLQAAGYLAVPTLIGFGDWIEFLRGLTPEWAWRGPMIATGFALYALFVYIAVRELEPLLGRDPAERRRRLRLFTQVPYFTGGLAICLSGAFNPVSPKLIVVSAAAATFGGASGLLWLPGWSLGRGPDARTPETGPPLARSSAWIALGTVALLVLVGVLGRGVRFGG